MFKLKSNTLIVFFSKVLSKLGKEAIIIPNWKTINKKLSRTIQFYNVNYFSVLIIIHFFNILKYYVLD